jgi:hypothetical protein
MRSLNKPETSAAGELPTLKARAATTAERLVAARAALSGAQARQAELLASDASFDAAALGQANMKTLQAQSVVDGLAQLAEATDAAIVAAEQQVAARRDRIEREAEGRAMDDVIAALEGATSDYAEAAQVLCGVLGGSAGRAVHSGQQFGASLRESTAAVIAMIGNISRDLGEAKLAILENRAAVPKPAEAAAPASAPTVVAREKVFLIQEVSWLENGQAQRAGRYTVSLLPTPLARVARAHDVALLPDSERAKALARGVAVVAGPAMRIVDLDTLARAEPPTMKMQGEAVAVDQPRATG